MAESTALVMQVTDPPFIVDSTPTADLRHRYGGLVTSPYSPQFPPDSLRLIALNVVDDGGSPPKPYHYDERFTDDWWDDDDGPASTYLSVVDLDGTEVARAELADVEGEPWQHYPTIRIVDEYAEILFFEVAAGLRRTGTGRAAVQLIAAHSTRPLLAISEKADEFWRALGWEEHASTKPDHRDRKSVV